MYVTTFFLHPAQLLNDIVSSMCDTFLTIVKKQNNILNYTAQNPKNTTEKLDITSELMQLAGHH